MPKPIKIAVTVEIEVDVADYSRTYGLSEGAVESDARDHLPRLVADAVHQRLSQVANGASLVGDLYGYLED